MNIRNRGKILVNAERTIQHNLLNILTTCSICAYVLNRHATFSIAILKIATHGRWDEGVISAINPLGNMDTNLSKADVVLYR